MNMKRYAIGIYALLNISTLHADPVSQSTSLSPSNATGHMMQAFSGDSASGTQNPGMYGSGGMNNNPTGSYIGGMPNGPANPSPNRPYNLQNMPQGRPNINPAMMPSAGPQGGPPPSAFGNIPGQNANMMPPGGPQGGPPPGAFGSIVPPPGPNVNMMPGAAPSGFNQGPINTPSAGNIPMQVPMPGGGTQTVYVPAGAANTVSNLIPGAQGPGAPMPPSMPQPGGAVMGNTRIIDDGGNLRVIVNPSQPPQGGGQMVEPIPTGIQQQGQQPAQNVIIIQPNAPQNKPTAKPPLVGPPPARPTAPAAPGTNAS